MVIVKCSTDAGDCVVKISTSGYFILSELLNEKSKLTDLTIVSNPNSLNDVDMEIDYFDLLN
jgi:hypothetical protein